MEYRPPVDQNLLADLVERRTEAPAVEYKNFMPLTENVERAKVARHICALANSGGGWLVFGFEDDGTPSEPHVQDLSAYSQDAINGIGARYLEPQPHCETHFVRAASGRVYPVVRVPAHGAIPVCAKADGPQEKGAPQGIRKGFHYMRAPGPKSVPIDAPEMWRELIRRCVLAERGTLLSSIGQLFDRPQAASDKVSPLDELFERVSRRWETMEQLGWPVDPACNRIAFGFRLVDSGGEPVRALPLNALESAIRSASAASGALIGESSGNFDPGWNQETRAKVTVVDDHDGYAGRRASPDGSFNLPMEWLIRDDGVGVEVTGIPEDNPWVHQAVEGRGRTRKWPTGQRLAPSFQVDTIAQAVTFVGRLAESYPDASGCDLMLDYLGLEGRELDEPDPGIYFSSRRTSATNERHVKVHVGIAALTAELPEVTASLVGPIFRLFDGWDIGAEYVQQRLAKGGRR